MENEPYANIREALGSFSGKLLIDVSQHDQDEYEQTGEAYAQLMFADGTWIRFYIERNGFCTSELPEGDRIVLEES